MTDAFSTDRPDEAEDTLDRAPNDGASFRTTPGEDGAFTIALTLELETVHVPLKRLQALREGAVLPLDAAEGPIPVRVVAGGRTVARGTLVSVGPGYGVLIGPETAEG